MTCPNCSNETDQNYRPFCSRRCADIDLARWMSGSYSVPSEAEDDANDVQIALEEAARKPH